MSGLRPPCHQGLVKTLKIAVSGSQPGIYLIPSLVLILVGQVVCQLPSEFCHSPHLCQPLHQHLYSDGEALASSARRNRGQLRATRADQGMIVGPVGKQPPSPMSNLQFPQIQGRLEYSHPEHLTNCLTPRTVKAQGDFRNPHCSRHIWTKSKTSFEKQAAYIRSCS